MRQGRRAALLAFLRLNRRQFELSSGPVTAIVGMSLLRKGHRGIFLNRLLSL